MAWFRLLIVMSGLLFGAGCSGNSGNSSPTSPSSLPDKAISLSGSLSFGDVAVGNQKDLTFTIQNAGRSTLTVSGMSVSGGMASLLTASWTSGTIASGASQTVTVRFAPSEAGSYSGTLTVNADHTTGTNTLPISGTATAPSFAGTWSGNYIVDRCEGTGSVQDYFCSARGVYPPGSVLPITLNLNQNGSSVSGLVAFGQVTGNVSGNVSSGGALVLQGTATSGTLTVQVTSWTTSVNGGTMAGSFAYNVGLTGTPGVAVVTSRLSNVTKR